MAIHAASDAELIAAARSGEAAAYGVLYERHSAAARRVASQLVKRQADVDDVVAETFARVLSALKRGIGPAEAFRPYLLTAVRRVAIDVLRGQRHQVPTEDTDLPDPGEPFIDPVEEGLDRSLVARAFLSLPERWSAVLWHTEIEEAKPAEVAAMLGMSANSVAALRYRAREGLRQAYLQLHLSGRADASCRPFAARLGAYVRGRLSRRHSREVDAHLRGCTACASACADLTAINDALRGVLAPVVLGGAASGYLAEFTHKAAAHAVPAHAIPPHTVPAHAAPGGMLARHAAAAGRVARLAVHRPVVPVAAAFAAATITVPTLYLIHPKPDAPSAGGPPSAIIRTHHPEGGSASPGQSRHVPGAAPSASPQPTTKGTSPGPGKPRPRPTTSRSGPASPSPSTSASPTSSPTTSASPSASPSPTVSVSASVAATAKLSVGLQVSGLLDLGVTALVKVNVSDSGTAGTGPMTATLTLPAGTTMLGLAGSSTWSCTTSSSGGTCTHAAINAGVAANFSFNMLVISLSGCGSSVLASVVSGSVSGSASSPQQVQCAGGLLTRILPTYLILHP